MIGSTQAFERTLVVAPHPDDEVLGAGGTMAALTQAGCSVFVAVVTTGKAPDFDMRQVTTVREECARAHEKLGVRETLWLDQPAARLSEVAHVELNAALSGVVDAVRPGALVLPFVGDIHMDHQLTFLSGLVAARPHGPKFPPLVLAYETLSETNWNAPYLSPSFQPNYFVDISSTIDLKLDAMAAFSSQVRSFPHERSIEALEALAVMRGVTVGCAAAEAFVLLRNVINFELA
ncbi:PIG-L deacetylase family protein [Pararhizobium mangrovi]|uniref:PIG-L deacetylase family protein n=1 Tax=Pararhizobium mangrovi TaxID=2590452 RepID=UPI0038B27CC9